MRSSAAFLGNAGSALGAGAADSAGLNAELIGVEKSFFGAAATGADWADLNGLGSPDPAGLNGLESFEAADLKGFESLDAACLKGPASLEAPDLNGLASPDAADLNGLGAPVAADCAGLYGLYSACADMNA